MIKLVAIGDVHAAFDKLWAALRAASAADAHDRPTPALREGRIRVVLLGDLVHPKTQAAYAALTGLPNYDFTNPAHLRAAARAQVAELLRLKQFVAEAGGNVVVLLGNHDHAAVHHDVLLGNAHGIEHREFDPGYGGTPLPPGLANWILAFPSEYELKGVHLAHVGPLPWMNTYDAFFYQSDDAKTWWQRTPDYVARAGYRLGIYGHTSVEEILVDEAHGLVLADALERNQFFEVFLGDELRYRVVRF